MEIWKAVKDYEGLYEVSNTGRVRSLERKVRSGKGCPTRTLRGAVMRPQVSRGYVRLMLCKDGKRKWHSVHRLVAMAFLPNPEELAVINHLDGNKGNNHIGNLQWCTPSENALHAFRTGLSVATEHSRVARIKANSRRVRCLDDGKEFSQLSEAARYYGLDRSSIGRTAHGVNKTSGGKRFEFVDKKD